MVRDIDILVISDVHLGTFGSRAKELNRYLKSVNPKMVILNGDIIDIWQFRTRYFPEQQISVVRNLLKISQKVPTYYITGNHDEALRKYSPINLGKIELVDQLELTINGKKYWFFHGDIFDASIQGAKWLAKLGATGYDFLIRFNNAVNWFRGLLGMKRMSFSKKIKNSVKRALKYIGDFEQSAAEVAIEKGIDCVVCGHIHQPQNRVITTSEGSVHYMNSGDWIENLTSLEYYDGGWHLYAYDSAEFEIEEIMESWSKTVKIRTA